MIRGAPGVLVIPTCQNPRVSLRNDKAELASHSPFLTL